MSAWNNDEQRLRDLWAATPAPASLRARYDAARADAGRTATGRSLRPLLLAAALTAAIAAGGVAFGAHRLASSGGSAGPPPPPPTPVPTSPASTSSPTAPPTPTAAAAGTWSRGRLATGAVADLALDDQAVYALIDVPDGNSPVTDVTQLVRIDRRTGARLTSAPITMGTHLVRAGNDVWVGAGGVGYSDATPNPTPTGSVLRFNATTLAAEGTLALPTPAPGFTPGYSVHVAAAGGTLVAGFGNKVEEIDPATGTVVGTIVVSSGQIVQDVAVSPAGDLIYVGAADASQTTTLTEWSVATGQLVGDRGSQASLGPVQLTATATGVWVSNSSGTLGGYDFRRSGDLGTVQGQPTVNDENLVHTRLARGVLWVLGGQLRCADPATGAIRATTRIPEASALVGDSRAMYVGTRDGLDLLAPDPACFG